jgi:protein O-mannosyl-transferase
MRPKQIEKSSARASQQHTDRAASIGPRLWAAALLLAVPVFVVYRSALHAPFIFDDPNGIVDNESIRFLWPLVGPSGHPGPLNPGPEMPSSPRPLVNLSLAVNYFFGGIDPFGYHVFSVVLHFLTALLLYAVVRRTLQLSFFERRFESSAGWLALAVAMLWSLHPLVTETVIYATQRSELMMALFYLAMLYCSLRYWIAIPLPFGEGQGEGSLPHARSEVALDPARPTRIVWLTLAVFACLAGMASKEVMVSAPLMILLFERTFVAGSFPRSIRRSWPLHIGLATTWILLLFVILRAPYGTAAGFSAGVPVSDWWLTQTKVLLMYLKLAFWPWPLLIHYQFPYFTTLGQAWMYVLPVLILGIATLVLLWRNHPVGYLGTALFAILAPTSLIPIRLEMAAERRMYLPLAALMILLVVGGYRLVQSAHSRAKLGPNALQLRFASRVLAAFVALLALTYGLVSAKRLAAYDNEMALWQEVLRFQPNNLVAHNNVGLILTHSGRLSEAIRELQATLAIKPDYVFALNNLGNALSAANRLPEAVNTFQSAIRIDPEYFQARNNLGIALTHMGRFPEAIEQLRQALRLKPGSNEIRCNLGGALTNSGRLDEAIKEFEAVLAVEPDNILALNNLSIALARAGRVPEAIEAVQHVLRLQPNYADAHTNLGLYLSSSGKISQAMQQFQVALQLNPNDANARYHFGNLLVGAGRASEAIGHLEQSIRLRPEFADAQAALGKALQQAGRAREAIEHYQAAVRLTPNIPAYANLVQAYVLAKQPDEAVATAHKAIEFAQTSNHPETVAQIQQWLIQYQAELQRGSDIKPGASSRPPQSK